MGLAASGKGWRVAVNVVVELAALLEREGVITPDVAIRALDRLQAKGGLLVDHLVRESGLDHTAIAVAVSKALGLPLAADEDVIAAPRSLAAHVPEVLARTHRVVPYELSGTVLHVALHDPGALQAGLEAPEGMQLRWCVGSAVAVEAGLARLYPNTMPRARPLPPPDGEIPNRDFGDALGLTAPPQPVLLFKRKQADEPLLLTRKKSEPPSKINSLGVAAERMFAAENLRAMSNVASAYLGNFFTRVVVLDLFKAPAVVLARHGVKHAVERADVQSLPGLGVMLTEQLPYHGMAVDEPSWRGFYAILGEPRPKSMLVMPVWQGDHARLMVYGDNPGADLYPDIKEFVTVAREMGMALESRGF